MNAFRVWIRPLQSTSRVRMEGAENALWLLKRLSQSFFFKSSQPLMLGEDSRSSFEVPYGSDLSGSRLRTLLGRTPEVKLMSELA